jgi:hypothetical protein
MPENDNKMGPGGYALTGAGVGAAGIGSSAGLIGISTAMAAAPILIPLGIIGGLICWAFGKDSDNT